MSSTSEKIASLEKGMKESAEKANSLVSNGEMLALKEQFENLQLDLRKQMLGVESTQNTVLTTFEEHKVET